MNNHLRLAKLLGSINNSAKEIASLTMEPMSEEECKKANALADTIKDHLEQYSFINTK